MENTKHFRTMPSCCEHRCSISNKPADSCLAEYRRSDNRSGDCCAHDPRGDDRSPDNDHCTFDSSPIGRGAHDVGPPKIYDGTGDDVIDISFPAGEKVGVLVATYQGDSNFIVTGPESWRTRRWSAQQDRELRESDGLINEIGVYKGKVPLAAGPSFIEIHADGNWTLNVA